MPAYRRERPIPGDERNRECFGQRDIGGIVRGQIRAKLPNTRQKHIMWIPRERESGKVFQRFPSAPSMEHPSRYMAAQRLDHFEVQKVRRVKRLAGREETVRYSRTIRGPEQDIHNSRCVDDDHLPSRAARTTLADDTRGATGSRSASRRRSSEMVGRSAMWRTSSNR